MEKRQQLCWSCKKACGGEKGCSWFNGHIPIHGWTATPTISDNVVIDGKVRQVHSFLIKKCPQYESDSKMLASKTKSNKVKAKEFGISERTYYRRKKIRRKYD